MPKVDDVLVVMVVVGTARVTAVGEVLEAAVLVTAATEALVAVVVVVAVLVTVAVVGDGSDMHPAIGESTSPILTATAIPATNSKRYK